MTILEIANRVVEINRNHSSEYDIKNLFDELYSLDAVSIENWGPEPEVYAGMEAILKKSEKWQEDVVEMHSFECSEPLVSDSSFAVTFTMDITYKSRGREKMTELAVYAVKDGKIVREEFQS